MKNTKGVILEKKETRMVEDGEVWNGLEMTILKRLAIFIKVRERWRGAFNFHLHHRHLSTRHLIAKAVVRPWLNWGGGHLTSYFNLKIPFLAIFVLQIFHWERYHLTSR